MIASCASPEMWRALLDGRGEENGASPDLPVAVREHLNECLDCRREALTIDPLLLFVAPHRPSSSPALAVREADADIAAMQLAVRQLRRARTVDAAATSERRWFGWRSATAAAAAAGFLALGLWTTSTRNEAAPIVATQTGPAAALEQWVVPASYDPEAVGGWSQAPLVEDVGRPDARVYEWNAATDRAPEAGHLSVVLIVDKTLDV